MLTCPGISGPKLYTPYGIAARTAVQTHQTIRPPNDCLFP